MSLQNVILTNNGFVYWTNSGTLYLANNAQIVNQLTFYINGDAELNQLQGDTSTVFFTNTSLVIKNVGATNAGATTIRIPFYDTGSVEVAQGTLQMNGGGSFNTWFASPGAAISFQSGNYTAQALAAFSGGGIFTLHDATLNLPQYAILAIETLFNHSGGTIDGAGKIDISGGLQAGTYQWNAGTISITNSVSAVFVEMGGVMTIQGANNAKNLLWGILVNNGIINWTNDNSSGGLYLGNQAGIINLSSFNLQCDASMNDISTNTNSAPVFFNEQGALLAKTANTGTTTIGVRFHDAGAMLAQAGTIELYNFVDTSLDPNLPLPTITMAGGKVQFDNNPAVHANISGSGEIISRNGLLLSGGRLTVIAITLSGNATNDETFDLSAFGTLTHNGGNLTQTANGILIIPLQSTNAGGYGKVTSTGYVTLAGTLSASLVSGAAPPIGTVFPCLICYERFNTFTRTNVPYDTTVSYTINGANVVVTNNAPALLGAIGQVTNTFNLSFAAVTNTPYTIQYTSNLVEWLPLTNFVATQVTNTFIIRQETNVGLGLFRVAQGTNH